MHRCNFRLSTLVVLAALLCPAAGLAQSGEETKKPDKIADSGISADQLARRISEATGDFEKVERIAFSFVVEVGPNEQVQRRHEWWPKQGKLEVFTSNETYELRHLHDHDLSKLADAPAKHAETWKKVADEASPKMAARAWKWFVNDSYWLLMPTKLFDPGVNRKLDLQGRLVLTFGDVGLTPGDRYTLHVNNDISRITRWDFKLQSGREGSFAWKDYQQFGPLTLSTRRVSLADEEPKTVIRFENIEVETD